VLAPGCATSTGRAAAAVPAPGRAELSALMMGRVPAAILAPLLPTCREPIRQEPRHLWMNGGATNGATVHLLGYRLLMRSQLSPSRASASTPPACNGLAGPRLGPLHPDADWPFSRPPGPIPRGRAAARPLRVRAARLQPPRPAASSPPRRRFRGNVRPAARAPRTTERRTPRRNRATSSRQPAGASPVRGDARVPGSSTPGVGREPGVEAEEDRPVEGAGDWPVRSIKRSLQRRQESPRKRTKREPSPYSCGEGHGRHQGTWSGCPRTLRRRGRGMVRRVSWELERPSVAPSLRGSGSRPVYNRQTGSDGWPPGSRRGS
jgi:hypothetical protein